MESVTEFASALASDSPSSSAGLDPTVITPGLPGFLVFAVLVVAAGLLLWDMLRRIRRTTYREEINERLDAEEAAAAAAAAADEAGASTPATDAPAK